MASHDHERESDPDRHHDHEVELPYFEGCDHPDLLPIRHALKEADESDARRVRQGGRSNTGPKGVLADYKQYQRELAEERDAAAKIRTQTVLQMAKALTLESSNKEKRNDSENEEDEDDEDEFLKEYRLKRLSELNTYYAFPRFGQLLYVKAEEYVDKVDSQPPGVRVVVHLYEHQIRACSRINKCLESLAKELTHVLFLAVVASEAKKDYDPYGLPSLIIYHQGEVESVIVRAHDHLDREFAEQDVCQLLSRNGLPLKPEAYGQVFQVEAIKGEANTSSIRSSSSGSTNRKPTIWRGTRGDDDEDEDDYE